MVASTAEISDVKEQEDLDSKFLHLSPLEEPLNAQKKNRQLQAKTRFVPLLQKARQASHDISPAEAPRLGEASSLEENGDTDAEGTDISPLGSRQALKKQTKQTWKLNDKKRSKALRHDRKAAAF